MRENIQFAFTYLHPCMAHQQDCCRVTIDFLNEAIVFICCRVWVCCLSLHQKSERSIELLI